MKKIMFVCHGNICRSPMAKYIFKSLTNEFQVESRATSTEEIGNDIYPPIKKALNNHNIPYERHYAKQITIDDYNKFDIIVCFDNYNLNNLKRMFNGNKEIKLLDKDIDDPWYTGDFDKTYNEIYYGCVDLISRIEE